MRILAGFYAPENAGKNPPGFGWKLNRWLQREHCIIIKRDFDTYNSLFFSGHNAILKKVAVHFFNDIAEILQRDWLLQVTKIMDPAETRVGGQIRENISIKLINKHLRSNNLMTDEIENTSQELFAYGHLLKQARNRRLAHIDRESYLCNEVLGQTSEEQLHKSILNQQKYCDLVGEAIDIGPLDFSGSSCAGDVHDLIKVLYINKQT